MKAATTIATKRTTTTGSCHHYYSEKETNVKIAATTIVIMGKTHTVIMHGTDQGATEKDRLQHTLHPHRIDKQRSAPATLAIVIVTNTQMTVEVKMTCLD